MPDVTTELAVTIRDLIARKTARAVAGLSSELGKITASGVKLDHFKHEFTSPLVLEPVADADIETSLEVPAHTETGTVVLPAIPTSGGPPTVPGPYEATFNFDKWVHDAKNLGLIKITKMRVKFKPEYKPGDRVVCAVVNSGRDVIILARVIPYA